MSCAGNLSVWDDEASVWFSLRSAAEQVSKSYSRLHGGVAMAFCLFGLVSNALHIRVLTSPKLRAVPVNLVLAAIAVCDFGKSTSYLIYIVRFVAPWESSTYPVCRLVKYTVGWLQFIRFHSWLSINLHTCALWLSVLLAAIRYMTMRQLQLHSAWASVKRAKLAIACIVFSITVISTPVVLQSRIELIPLPAAYFNKCVDVDNLHIETVDIVRRTTYANFAPRTCVLISAQLWLQGTLYKTIPCLILLALSRRLIGTLSEMAALRRQNSERWGRDDHKYLNSTRTTTIIVLIVIVFVFTEIPQGLLTIASALDHGVYEHVYQNVADVLDALSLLQSSASFLLYASLSTEYRRHFVKVILHPSTCISSSGGFGRSLTFTYVSGVSGRGGLDNHVPLGSGKSTVTLANNGSIHSSSGRRRKLFGGRFSRWPNSKTTTTDNLDRRSYRSPKTTRDQQGLGGGLTPQHSLPTSSRTRRTMSARCHESVKLEMQRLMVHPPPLRSTNRSDTTTSDPIPGPTLNTLPIIHNPSLRRRRSSVVPTSVSNTNIDQSMSIADNQSIMDYEWPAVTCVLDGGILGAQCIIACDVESLPMPEGDRDGGPRSTTTLAYDKLSAASDPDDTPL